MTPPVPHRRSAGVMAMRGTTADIPDQAGRGAVGTGANGGLGLETAKALAGAGAHVVMPSRNEAKAEAAAASIRAVHPAASLEVIACDLSSQSSTKRAAGEIRDRHQRIDLLVANAGRSEETRLNSST